MRDEKVVEKLLEPFKEESWELKLWPAVSLGEMEVEICESPLIRVLESDHPNLPRRAGFIFGLMGSEKAKKAIIEKEKRQVESE